ncbi:hypothetical protein LCGC14_2320770 [marine sediment metagenome]|uniref:Uncharacterized protein n=1 Tax=marine sediment metagenome TaxID=412755 RepID=A0A0F9CIF6_9ZZZZ
MKKNKEAVYISTRRPILRKLKRRARNIPYPGQPILAFEFEKLERCWYCKGINTVGREEEDTGRSQMASTLSDFTIQSLGTKTPGPDKVLASYAVNRSLTGYRVAPIAGSDGKPRTVKNNFTITSHTGCKHCGTINWRGKY